jgi:hypothetical protein
MFHLRTPLAIALLLACYIASGLPFTNEARAQQVTISTPFQRTGERFFENTNVGWSFRGPGFSARFGGGNVAAPPFGGFNPAAGLSGGAQFQRGGFSGGLNFNFSQGVQRSHTTIAPVLTLTNGQPGHLFIGSQRPFVTGVVPIVGAGAVGYLPIVEPQFAPALPMFSVQPPLWQSQLNLRPPLRPADDGCGEAIRLVEDAGIANRPVVPRFVDPPPPSRKSLQLQRETEEAARIAEAQQHLERGRQAERNGKPQVARHYYRLAARAAAGELKETILAELARLE